GLTGSPLFFEDELGGWILALIRADRPGLVIQIEYRRYGDDIHVGLVIGLERAHVTPVERFLLVLVYEVVSIDAIVVYHFRQNVFAKVVAGALVLCVFQKNGKQHISIEKIDSH